MADTLKSPNGAAQLTRAPRLGLVLGDQLDQASPLLAQLDPAIDALVMVEAVEESRHVWSTLPRTGFFISAMRHHAAWLRSQGWRVLNQTLSDREAPEGLMAGVIRLVQAWQQEETQHGHPACDSWWVVAPGDWRVWQSLREAAQSERVQLQVLDDPHFLLTVREFRRWMGPKGTGRLEPFYRMMRKRTGLLMTADGQPEGGQWNFDHDNRQPFPKTGPGPGAGRLAFEPDTVTRQALSDLAARLAGHPGSLASFAWPVTRPQALQSLAHFIEHRLPHFGRHQDALWPGEPWLFHSHLSAALNVKLLHPMEVMEAAIEAYRHGHADIAAVEGFVRQILGWREYVRGVYWLRMPEALEDNALDAHEPLPSWFWTGETDMACLRDALRQTLDHGYAHHIQRLMVLGVYLLMRGVDPKAVHEWFLAVYVDAVEWVELPNSMGMSQHADGGFMASKPYAASGAYIERMSAGRHCASCRYSPKEKTGERACPYTVLYWDFLIRHEARWRAHPRMSLPVKHLDRWSEDEKARHRQAARIHIERTRGESLPPGPAMPALPLVAAEPGRVSARQTLRETQP